MGDAHNVSIRPLYPTPVHQLQAAATTASKELNFARPIVKGLVVCMRQTRRSPLILAYSIEELNAFVQKHKPPPSVPASLPMNVNYHSNIHTLITHHNLQRDFSIGHININWPSTNSHFALLETHIQTRTFDAIAITATFLTDQTSTTHLQLPGYNFIHHNRIGKIGGGIGLYVRSQ